MHDLTVMLRNTPGVQALDTVSSRTGHVRQRSTMAPKPPPLTVSFLRVPRGCCTLHTDISWPSLLFISEKNGRHFHSHAVSSVQRPGPPAYNYLLMCTSPIRSGRTTSSTAAPTWRPSYHSLPLHRMIQTSVISYASDQLSLITPRVAT